MKRSILTALILLLLATSATAADGPPILLKNRTIATQNLPLAWTQLSDHSGRHVLVQFTETPNLARQAALADMGLQLLVPVPNHAYVAYVEPRDWAREKSLSPLRYIGELDAVDKIHPRLIDGDLEEYAIAADGRVDLLVRFFADVSVERIETAIYLSGAELLDFNPALHAAFVRVEHLVDIWVLAEMDEVRWVTQPT
ncbi:MAG: hypothetical protein ACTSXZ_08345, partial [Alphaproteobacteria bacterium]